MKSKMAFNECHFFYYENGQAGLFQKTTFLQTRNNSFTRSGKKKNLLSSIKLIIPMYDVLFHFGSVIHLKFRFVDSLQVVSLQAIFC
jgi:hypothetical protein